MGARIRTTKTASNKRLLLVAVFGAAVGCSAMHGYAAATSCASPYWRLALSAADEPDESLWPTAAILSSGAPITLGSVEPDAKIYGVAAEYP